MKQKADMRNGMPIQKLPNLIPHVKAAAMIGEEAREPPCSTIKRNLAIQDGEMT